MLQHDQVKVRKLDRKKRARHESEHHGVFASPSAVEGFTATLMPKKNSLTTALKALVIGPTTQRAAAKHFSQVVAVEESTVQFLANTAEKELKKGLN